MVVGRDDQRTEGDERVEGKGCIRLVVSGTEGRLSSSNVMTRLVEMTVLSHSTL